MSAKPTQRQLVRRYLSLHPWSTVMEIRAGIQAEHGVYIERIQARLADIERHYHLDRRQEGVCTAYRLGLPREVPRPKTDPSTSRFKIEDVCVTCPAEMADDIREAVQAIVDRHESTRAQDDSIDLLDFMLDEVW